jgi:hypothetical protein
LTGTAFLSLVYRTSRVKGKAIYLRAISCKQITHMKYSVMPYFALRLYLLVSHDSHCKQRFLP